MALVTAEARQDKSPSLLATLSASLLSSFSPSDVITDSGKAICEKALLKVSSLSRRGYLVGSAVNAQVLAELVSAYTVKTAVTSSRRRLDEKSSPYDVSTAASWLVQGVQLGMASGEVPVSLITSNIQVAVSSSLITNSGNSVLSTPATAAQAAYGSIQPKITLGPAGLSACAVTGGYAQLSVLQWSVNPYAGSTGVKSPLLRFSSAAQASAPIIQNQVQQKVDHVSFTLPGIPAYYIALQFSSMQNFNFSAISSSTAATTRGPTNFTLPACTLYNGAAYVPCNSCNISSYTNYNVTYSCHDITQLCPPTSRRLLKAVEYESTGAMIIEDYDFDEEEETESYSERDSENGTGSISEGNEEEEGNRVDRDLSFRLINDDDQSAQKVSSISYGVLIQSIAAEFSAVLSSNPFLLDPAKSTIVFTFMGILTGTIIILSYYFIRRDYNERLHKIYVKSGADNVARKLLKDDIVKNGGKGDISDLGSAFHNHVKSLNRKIKVAKSIPTRLADFFSSTERKRRRASGVLLAGTNFTFDRYDDVQGDFDSDAGDDDYHLHHVFSNFEMPEGEGNNEESKNNEEINDDNDESKDNNDSDDGVDQGINHDESNFAIETIYPDDIEKQKQLIEVAAKNKSAKMKAKRLIDSKSKSNESIDKNWGVKQFGTAAVVTEFLVKLFPGRSIFTGKRNALEIVSVHHNYFSMFVGSTVMNSRLVRFVSLINLVLASIFADTVFFGIFFPHDSNCATLATKVRNTLFTPTLMTIHFITLF